MPKKTSQKSQHRSKFSLNLAEQYEALQTAKRIDSALLEAQQQAESNPARLEFDEFSASLRNRLAEKPGETNA